MTQPNAPVTAEIRDLRREICELMDVGLRKDADDALPTFVAEQERKARLDEHQKVCALCNWTNKTATKSECKRRAELESAGTERSEKA